MTKITMRVVQPDVNLSVCNFQNRRQLLGGKYLDRSLQSQHLQYEQNYQESQVLFQKVKTIRKNMEFFEIHLKLGTGQVWYLIILTVRFRCSFFVLFFFEIKVSLFVLFFFEIKVYHKKPCHLSGELQGLTRFSAKQVWLQSGEECDPVRTSYYTQDRRVKS